MLPYADIREAYQKTFANSNSIVYHLEIYSIQTYQKSAFVSGRYELIQSIKGSKKKKVFRGRYPMGSHPGGWFSKNQGDQLWEGSLK